MSARDDLLSLLYGERPMGMDAEPYSREGDADEILARHAHELADEIREEANDEPIVPQRDGKRDPIRNSLLFAADLIDPEVA